MMALEIFGFAFLAAIVLFLGIWIGFGFAASDIERQIAEDRVDPYWARRGVVSTVKAIRIDVGKNVPAHISALVHEAVKAQKNTMN